MPYLGNPAQQRFSSPRAASVYSGDGSTVAFTLEEAVTTDEDILVSVDGVIQEPSVAYAVSSGTTLTFTAAPSSNAGNNIFVYYIARTFGSISMPDGQNVNASNFSASGTGAITGNTTVGGTLGVTGAVTANAGVVVDNITIDGTEIDLSSGDLTIDVAGDLIIDVDGEEILIKDAGTHIGGFKNVGTNFVIKSVPDNSDIIFQGTDGGSGIEAARFDMSAEGALCLGATSQVGAGILGISFNDSSVHGIDIQVEVDASGAGFLVFRKSNGGAIGQIKRNGTADEIQYVTTSDYRLKENVNYNFDASSVLKKLKPCEFNWIEDEKNTTITGFLAHEVQEIYPHAASGEKDATEILKDADDKEQTIIKPQGIDKSDLVPLLVKSLQEALTEIDTLKTKVAALESA